MLIELHLGVSWAMPKQDYYMTKIITINVLKHIVSVRCLIYMYFSEKQMIYFVHVCVLVMRLGRIHPHGCNSYYSEPKGFLVKVNTNTLMSWDSFY